MPLADFFRRLVQRPQPESLAERLARHAPERAAASPPQNRHVGPLTPAADGKTE